VYPAPYVGSTSDASSARDAVRDHGYDVLILVEESSFSGKTKNTVTADDRVAISFAADSLALLSLDCAGAFVEKAASLVDHLVIRSVTDRLSALGIDRPRVGAGRPLNRAGMRERSTHSKNKADHVR
jgi:hypothetical protein